MIENIKREREQDKLMSNSRIQLAQQIFNIMGKSQNENIKSKNLLIEFDFERMSMGYME